MTVINNLRVANLQTVWVTRKVTVTQKMEQLKGPWKIKGIYQDGPNYSYNRYVTVAQSNDKDKIMIVFHQLLLAIQQRHDS